MKVLIPGITGRARRSWSRAELARRGPRGHRHRSPPVARRAARASRCFQVDIRKRAAEDVFRKHRPEAVIHMATVTHLTVRNEDRYRINLGGTRAVFEHCAHYGVKRCIFVGRHTYYGAAADSPLYHTEDEPPMRRDHVPRARRSRRRRSLRRLGAVALSRARHLRAAHVLHARPDGAGHARRRSSTAQRVPTVLGFDPLFQFMHEEDAADAIALALEKQLRGVFNVAGPQPVPLSMLIRATGRTPVPMPEIAAQAGVRTLRAAAAAAGRGRAPQVSRRRRRLVVPHRDRLQQRVRRRSDHRRFSQRRRLSRLPQLAREEELDERGVELRTGGEA